MKLSCSDRDSVVFLNSERFARIIKTDHDKLLCLLYRRHMLRPFFTEPCCSDTVDIFYISKSSAAGTKTVEISRHDIQGKGLSLPHGDDFVLMRLLHVEGHAWQHFINASVSSSAILTTYSSFVSVQSVVLSV